jgi:hydroxymethylbilane synthase
MGDRVTSDITAPILYHAVSQGALAVEIRSNDTQVREICKPLTHWQTEWKCLAERACLRVLEGGCSVPVGAQSSLQVSNDGGLLTITGCVTAIDGSSHVEHTITEEVKNKGEAEAVGVQLAKILIDTGAKTILDDITKDRERRVGEAKSEEEKAKATVGTPVTSKLNY